MLRAPSPRLRGAWIACGYGFITLVVYLSLTPSPIPAPSIEGVKTGHVIAYAWLVLWFSQAYHRIGARLAWAAAFVLMGVMLEYLQGMTGYRTFAYSDMVDNAIGVVLGLVLASIGLGSLFPQLAKA